MHVTTRDPHGRSLAMLPSIWLWRLWIVGVLLLSLAGCEGLSFLTAMAPQPSIPAKFKLPARRTLVIVDDPQLHLGDIQRSRQIAAAVGFHLVRQNVITPEQLVTQERLWAYANGLGDQYPMTPIDQIGRALDAQQVIHVLVDAVALAKEDTVGAIEPTARMQVKVIDATAGARVFPPLNKLKDSTAVQRGHVTIAKTRMTIPDQRNSRAAQTGWLTDLTNEAGLTVAQLFYAHRPDEFHTDSTRR